MASKLSPKPSPKVPTEFDFYTALGAVADGQRVARREWGNIDEWLCLADSKVMIHKSTDKMLHPFTILDGDMAGTDWYLLPPYTVKVRQVTQQSETPKDPDLQAK